MKYKKFGKTNKQVSVIGFGGMRFPGKDKIYDYDYCAEMIRKANSLGMNYFDTAPYYNDDHSEKIYGHAFKDMPNDFYISTKSAEKNGSKLRESIERSLKRLNVEKITFFNIWCVLSLEDFESRMVKGGAYETALKAKEEGLIEHLCFTTHCNGEDIDTIIKKNLFEGVTLGYNIINAKYRQKGIESAYKHDLGVVTMNPIGGGLINDNPDYFSYIKKEHHNNVIESAIKFNASHKEISVVLTGMDSLEHVVENISYGNEIEDFNEDYFNSIKNNTKDDLDRLCTGCKYCEHCPESIPVSKFMLAYNKSILSDDKAVKDNIKMHWRIAPDLVTKCIECGLCEDKCTQHLPIIDRLKYFRKIYDI